MALALQSLKYVMLTTPLEDWLQGLLHHNEKLVLLYTHSTLRKEKGIFTHQG